MRPATSLAALLAAAIALGVAPVALAQTGAQPTPAEAAHATRERDRAAILAQAGDYRVRFDMRETTSFRDGYAPLEPKTSGGHEIVRVIEDTPNRIVLQHILVMEHGGQTHVIKHWRQDWVFEPETVLTYAGPDEWVLTSVSEADRRGAWSQTVWQTDDSPRYGGVGRWSYDNGVTEWVSNPTWRPLARRDATRNPIYDRYLGGNRHALTPTGWVHLQDNMKMAAAEGSEAEPVVVVHEDVVNTYARFDGFDPKPGDDYWAVTADYWAAVRAAWDAAIQRGNGVYIEEEAQYGSVVSEQLMTWADEIQAGDLQEAAAIQQAQDLIETRTSRPGA